MEKIENLIDHIGKKVKYYRNLNKVSLSKLAKDAGISKSTLFGLEEGRSNPTISTLINIATTLNIDLNELIGDIADENFRSSKLSLISKSSSSNYSLYRLTLAPYEVFRLDIPISSVNITVINGEINLIDKSIILHPNDSLITNNCEYKALGDGATATLKIYSKYDTVYTKNDILKDSASKEILEDISRSSINRLITRAIFSSIAPIDELNKTKYINYVEIIERKESHYYFYRRYLGLVGSIQSFFREQNLNLETVESLIEYLNLVNSNKLISKKDLSIINNTPIEELKSIIEKELKVSKKGIIKLNSIYDLLTIDISQNSSFYIIDELIDIEKSEENITLIISIYRALESIEFIYYKELNSIELKIENILVNNLIKALYYAYCGSDNLSLDYLKNILTLIEDEDLNSTNSIILDRLKLSINQVKATIKNYKDKKVLNRVDTLESIAKDLGLYIEAKELLSPVLDKSGIYCYIFKS